MEVARNPTVVEPVAKPVPEKVVEKVLKKPEHFLPTLIISKKNSYNTIHLL